MTKDAELAIEVENLTKRYGDLSAVNDTSFLSDEWPVASW